MKDHFEEICAWNAGHVITDLYKELGLDRTYYLNELAEQMGVDVDTVITWRRRERGLPVRYTHRMVMDALDAVLEQYCKNKGLLTSQKAPIMAKWEERREAVSRYLEGMIDVEPPVEQFKERMKDSYQTWTLGTITALYDYFDTLNSTTWNDLHFWRVLLSTPREARANKVAVLTRRKVSARCVLDCLYNSQVAQWQDLLKTHKPRMSKEKVWARLLKKMEEDDCDPLIWVQLLDLLIERDTGTLIGEPRLGQDEMALFILFKYCLTEDAQDEVLELWA